MNCFKLFLSVMLVNITMNGYGQNSRLAELSLHKWIKGKQKYEVFIDFKYARDSENLEKYCSKIFFKDSISSTLEEATYNYFNVLGKEKTTLEPDLRTKLKLELSGELGNCQNYLIEYKSVNLEKKQNVEITHSFIYDTLHHRVLTIQDILKPEYVNYVSESYTGSFSVAPIGLVWFKNKGRVVSLEVIKFMTSKDWFTEEFNQLVGIDSLLEKETEKALAEVSRTKEIYDSLMDNVANHFVSSKVICKEVRQLRDREKLNGTTADVLVRQGKYKLYPAGEMREFINFFYDGIEPYRFKETLKSYLKNKNVTFVKKRLAFDKVDVLPQFAECDGDIEAWISQKIKYPPLAEENGIQGDVICSFMINIDGSCSDYIVEKKVDPTLDNEAIRVLKTMPKWTPGKNQNVQVPVRCYVMIRFVLN